MVQQMMASNPGLGEALRDPETLRQMFDSRNLQVSVCLASAPWNDTS